MQFKSLLVVLAGLAMANAAAAPVQQEIVEVSGPLMSTVEARAADINWQATGGCKTDWANRCNAACRGEAQQKKYTCTSVKSKIWRQSCVFGWSVCDCTCVR
ncbi:hypothetical protein QBC35DRAFT_514031 [Podospora australis]|uniref:Invertebrate defensins family profile domain-containing protein n=1 Tax=Podospora australis TaxID=1536484 RepID=A0AAN7AJY8_9PEZI|nr:hypothetical protein QBC35DRAFT_514031 [Podospora australis]